MGQGLDQEYQWPGTGMAAGELEASTPTAQSRERGMAMS